MKEKNKERKEKKEKKNKKVKNENKVKFTEKISLTLRKRWLVNGTKTLLIVLILVAAYMALNLWAEQADLPEFDVTENQIYTLSDTSKKAIVNVDQDVKIYVYGFEDGSTLINLLKQYNKANDKITYEIITEETNYEMIQEHSLQEGYYVLILKSGDSQKVIDASSEFTTYDYTTYQSVDTTEQTITNSILALSEENKPKVYFVQGHGEYDSSNLSVLETYLQNEAFEIDDLNIVTAGSIPDDCDILAIMSPTTDFYELEVQAIQEYIAKGGKIYFSMDVVSQTTELPNIQTILDEYGVSVQNGYILEYADGQSMSSYPYIFMPQVSSTNKITADIYSDSAMWLVYSAKIQYKTDDELQALNVETETLLSSSDDSAFITDLSSSLTKATESATIGSSDIASLITKTITTTNEAGEEEETTSKLILVASGSFITDYQVSALSQTYPLSYIGSNKDFVINSMAYLGEKNNTLTIRKDYSSSTYTPTSQQNMIVVSVIIAVPLLIIVIGIVIWSIRKKR